MKIKPKITIVSKSSSSRIISQFQPSNKFRSYINTALTQERQQLEQQISDEHSQINQQQEQQTSDEHSQIQNSSISLVIDQVENNTQVFFFKFYL